MVNAVFINARNRTVTEVSIEEIEFRRSIAVLLEARFVSFEEYDQNDHRLYFDEEGSIIDELFGGFSIPNFGEPFAGHGVIAKIIDNVAVDHTVNIERLVASITWIDANNLGRPVIGGIAF